MPLTRRCNHVVAMTAIYSYASAVETTKALRHRLTSQGYGTRLSRYHFPAALITRTHPTIVWTHKAESGGGKVEV